MLKLTPEILQSFGFVKTTSGWSHPTYGTFNELPEHEQFLRHIFELGIERSPAIKCPLKIHQI